MNTKNAKRRVCVALGVLAMLAPATHAFAQPDHDAGLAKVIADKVSERLGDLRDGFDHDELPVFTAGPDKHERKVQETLQKPGMKRILPVTGTVQANIDPIRTSSVRVVYDGPIVR